VHRLNLSRLGLSARLGPRAASHSTLTIVRRSRAHNPLLSSLHLRPAHAPTASLVSHGARHSSSSSFPPSSSSNPNAGGMFEMESLYSSKYDPVRHNQRLERFEDVLIKTLSTQLLAQVTSSEQKISFPSPLFNDLPRPPKLTEQAILDGLKRQRVEEVLEDCQENFPEVGDMEYRRAMASITEAGPTKYVPPKLSEEDVAVICKTVFMKVRDRGEDPLEYSIGNLHDLVELEIQRMLRENEPLVTIWPSELPVTAAEEPEDAADAAIFNDMTQQMHLETQALKNAVERYRRTARSVIQEGKGANLKPSQKLLLRWYEPLVRALKAEQKMMMVGEPGNDRSSVRAFLTRLSAPELACIVLHQVLNQMLIHPAGETMLTLTHKLADAVMAEINLKHLQSNDDAWRSFRKTTPASKLIIPVINARARLLGEGVWSPANKTKVGGALLKILMEVATVNANPNPNAIHLSDPSGETVKAFYEYKITGVYPKFRKVGMLACHEQVLRILEDEYSKNELWHPRLLPMVAPPKPWSSPWKGGYYFVKTCVMRTRGSHKQNDALKSADLTQVYEALNFMGSVPWKINNQVYEVVKECWEVEKGGAADIPSRVNVELPPKPALSMRDDPKGYKDWQRQLAIAKRKNQNLHSLRCDLELKLQVAKEFKDKGFYFPFNIDFRGRAYPIPPHLNHTGSDLCRGLLSFAEKKPLGKMGLRWLFIHLANVYGNDKLSLDGRRQWTEDNLDRVLQTAKNPNGPIADRFWVEAENPWQCLATCFEIEAALASGDPEAFESRFPVHQDGSCNGLQHYAALGKDHWGGQSVNLTRNNSLEDKPQDVYSGVCAEVIVLVAADAADPENEHHILAKALDGNLSRKIIKQTVMTSVYGVTLIGAKEQILNRLRELSEEELVFEGAVDGSTRDRLMAKAALYLADKTLESLSNMFSSARAIMKWLADCAHIVALQRQPVSWITPLGLPVVQPYRKATSFQVKTLVQAITIADHNDLLPVSPQRQKAAFPPNFVHSLDATHMMMTALDCRDKNLTYSSVHDSFWTHAGTMEVMNESLRAQFVKLYSGPVLEDFREELCMKYPSVTFPPIPERGTLQLEDVMHSPYFFS
jgi:DNA-directed RNA polymerase